MEDLEYEVIPIVKVQEFDGNKYDLEREDGFHIVVEDSPITPRPGMLARFYGRGIGYPVRGIFLAGFKVFYRTREEDEIFRNEQMFGKTCQEWLDRWDNGKTVWSIEMGGLGPGYEQAIQITLAEILRHLVQEQYDASKWQDDREEWKKDREQIEAMSFQNEEIMRLGLSGAQFGAALNIAISFYIQGPVALMTNPDLDKKRKIQVSKNFP